MQYQISGADGETGEDIVMTIDAKSSEEARAKAARKGILVEGCRRAESQGGVAVASPTKPKAASHAVKPSTPPAKKKSVLARVGVFAAVLLVAICAAGGAWYKFVGLPEHERMHKTLADTIIQTEKTEAMSRENTESQIDELERRKTAFAAETGSSNEPFVAKVTSNGRWSKTEAIKNDFIITRLLNDHPEMEEMIREQKTTSIENIVYSEGGKDIPRNDRHYIRQFSLAIRGLRE